MRLRPCPKASMRPCDGWTQHRCANLLKHWISRRRPRTGNRCGSHGQLLPSAPCSLLQRPSCFIHGWTAILAECAPPLITAPDSHLRESGRHAEPTGAPTVRVQLDPSPQRGASSLRWTTSQSLRPALQPCVHVPLTRPLQGQFEKPPKPLLPLSPTSPVFAMTCLGASSTRFWIRPGTTGLFTQRLRPQRSLPRSPLHRACVIGTTRRLLRGSGLPIQPAARAPCSWLRQSVSVNLLRKPMWRATCPAP